MSALPIARSCDFGRGSYHVVWDANDIGDRIFIGLSTLGRPGDPGACLLSVDTSSDLIGETPTTIFDVADLDRESEPRFHSKLYMTLQSEGHTLYGATHTSVEPSELRKRSARFRGAAVFAVDSESNQTKVLGYPAPRQGIRALAKLPGLSLFYGIAYPGNYVFSFDAASSEVHRVRTIKECRFPPYSLWEYDGSIYWTERDGEIRTVLPGEARSRRATVLPSRMDGRLIGMDGEFLLLRDISGNLFRWQPSGPVLHVGQVDARQLSREGVFAESVVVYDGHYIIPMPYQLGWGYIAFAVMDSEGVITYAKIPGDPLCGYTHIFKLLLIHGILYAVPLVLNAAEPRERWFEVVAVEQPVLSGKQYPQNGHFLNRGNKAKVKRKKGKQQRSKRAGVITPLAN